MPIMNKNLSAAVARMATAVFLLTLQLVTAMPSFSASKQNITTMPDFAYPKKVAESAGKDLAAAISAGRWPDAVKATIEKITACNLISSTDLASRIAEIDSVCALAPEKWKSAFILLKGSLLTQIYEVNSWKVDRRVLSVDSIPENPMEWSKDIFASEIAGICSAALSACNDDDRPLKEWGAFLKDTAFAYDCNMTVEEFIASQCSNLAARYATNEMTDVIPFFRNDAPPATPVEKCGELRLQADSLLSSLASKHNQNLLYAFALQQQVDALPYSMQVPAALEAYDKVKGTEGEQLILIGLRRYLGTSVEAIDDNTQSLMSMNDYVKTIRKSIETFPKGRYANGLRNTLNDIIQPSTRINYNMQYLSTDTITMQATLSNCNESWILIFDYSRYVNEDRPPKTSEVAANYPLVKAVKITADGTVPFSDNIEAKIGVLKPGTYVAIPSASSSKSGIYADIANNRWREPFTVSDISVLTLRCPDNSTKVFVVSADNGRPLEGAKVEIYTYPNNYQDDAKLSATLTTDSEGCVSVTDKRFSVKAYHQGSTWSSNQRYSNNSIKREASTSTNVNLLTNLSIYHPGDTIETVAVAYSASGNSMVLNPNGQLTIKLLDANNKTLDEQQCGTDRFGRASCKFRIPEDGLLGNWRVQACGDNARILGNCYVEVADYVAPTFFVTTDNSDSEPEDGATVYIRGEVMTYSGMPLSGAKVDYRVNYQSPMRWWFGGYASYNGSVTTDASGKYEIELPTANLKGTAFEKGLFDVNISATSPAGETQQGPTQMFALGKEYRVVPELDRLTLEVNGTNNIIKFYVEDMLRNKVKKELSYSIIRLKDEKTVAEGTFTAPDLYLPADSLPSASYMVKVNLADDKDASAQTLLTLWRSSDSAAPEGTGLWTPVKNIYAKPGKNTLHVTIGSGITDRWIPALLSSDNTIRSLKWLHIEHDNITLPIEAPKGKECLQLNLNYISDLKFEYANIRIYSSESDDLLEVKTESFRDRLSAGDRENWTFRFNKKYSQAGIIPAMAVMTDKALNAIAPFNWSFYPNSGYYPLFFNINHPYNRQQTIFTNIRDYKYLKYNSIELPLLQDYNRDWGLGITVRGLSYATISAPLAAADMDFDVASESNVVMRKSAAHVAYGAADMNGFKEEAVVMDDAAMTEGILEEPELQVAAFAADGEGGPADTAELRAAECPVAFFMPYLTSDSDGMLSVDFTVPNFNTTWAFQMIGYDEQLQTAKITLEATASKPVMVTTNAPRFVRTGDRILLTATAFNNSGSEAAVKGRLEVVDLLSGKLIASRDFAEQSIADAANRLMSMEWTVADGLSNVGFRAYAESGTHKDGEQAVVPVLPASTPVVESTPFWVAPEDREISVKLPKFKSTDQVTLQYCDNPAWYCLTALPEIVDTDSKSITAQARALFGNATAFHLISSHTSLKDGLEALLSDKDSPFAAMRSNLEKDGQLKISELNNTPWVNDAESETLRMSRLSSLLDAEKANKTISGILEALGEAQTPTGGWSWCPDMRPSSWITSEVVRYLAMCSYNGALTEFPIWENIARKAVGFVDGETIDDYHKYHKKGESLAYLLDWIYIRSSLPKNVIPQSGKSREMNSLTSKALADVAKEWKDYDIAEKTKAAMTLARFGNVKEANAILESIRQYASEAPEKGIWFDNLSSGQGSILTLRTTTLALQAFNEVQPHNKVIDGLRQWMVLGRQYQDWGKKTDIAETVNAILTTGTDWTSTSSSDNATIYIGGKKIELPAVAALTGAFTATLKAEDASKKTLTVKRDGKSPAWGGVICQYVSPIEDVKASSVPDLLIEKRLIALEEQPDGSLQPKEGIELKKGMRVRVTLVLTAGRDLDYVAVNDSRSACLEPSEQLSGISRIDGLWYYKEVRDDATNLYFDTLPKGVHVISYDCRVSQDGEFSCGIATAQSQYSPLATAHSAGFWLKSR